jgi:hypothetical protein
MRELAAQVLEQVLQADPGCAGGQSASGHAFQDPVDVRVVGVEGVELLTGCRIALNATRRAGPTL